METRAYTEEEKKEVLEQFYEIWKENPDLRFGQLICNIISDPALYYIEDFHLIKKLKEGYKK